MAKAAEAHNIIEKPAWENESSMIFFLMENQKQACWHAVCGVKANKTLRVDIK